MLELSLEVVVSFIVFGENKIVLWAYASYNFLILNHVASLPFAASPIYYNNKRIIQQFDLDSN